jgi:tRNA A-37 threonylcarbamoyl transferase component Bud32|eukprot:XP_024460655.1 G-type lectin S-receptor-like serine/threonine-protein kinase LECRK3 [Populus trichocarpa]
MASAYSALLLVFFFWIYEPVSPQQSRIELGSSLSTNIPPTSWRSPSRHFAFGFYRQGSGFIVGIWLASKPDATFTWTINRDVPHVSSNATLELTKKGKLLLRRHRNNATDEEIFIANFKGSASYAQMLDSGNFVLYNEHSEAIWESFSFPTDTILGGQNLYKGGELFSRASAIDLSTGRFHLKMQDDGNLVLYPVDTLDLPLDAYWSSDTYDNPGIHLILTGTGDLLLVNQTLHEIEHVSPSGSESNSTSIIYRATLEYDGIFRLYSHNFDGGAEYIISLMWHVPVIQCEVRRLCGFNSYCTMNDDDQPDCLCLPGTAYVDPNQRFHGCERDYNEGSCKHTNEMSSLYNITVMDQIAWDDNAYFQASMSEEGCRKSCLEDCNCAGALYESGNCKKQKYPVKYAWKTEDQLSKSFFKVALESIKSSNHSSAIGMVPSVIQRTSKKAVVLILVMSLAFITWCLVALAISGLFIFKSRVIKGRMQTESGNFGLARELTLRAFSYRELKKATKGFKEELGKGSSGAVYKGTLYKGKKAIAVKRLEKVVSESEREFLAEMRSIGKTHHKNLVRLLGYCTEGSHRLLVYEYMSNGSLANLLFRNERIPDWSDRVKIALDIAKGILYLHEECEAPIIHCDIKPQNILMDNLWTAKISDFGLAKLLVPDQTRTLTIARGTPGYMAPEWTKISTPTSVKVDVYSYGVVLLEIVFCRRNMKINVSKPEEILLSKWAYELLVARELDRLDLGEDVDRQKLEKMVMIGIWCIQDEPGLRPSMKTVVMMLEGITDVSVPPHPTSASA